MNLSDDEAKILNESDVVSTTKVLAVHAAGHREIHVTARRAILVEVFPGCFEIHAVDRCITRLERYHGDDCKCQEDQQFGHPG